jgi:hypothetical protein
MLLSLGPGGLAEGADSDSSTTAPKWFVTLYAGRYAHEHLTELLSFRASFREKNSQVLVVAVARELWRYKDLLALEAEGQVGRHVGAMDHWEFNGLAALRWHPFPWDEYLNTSLAVGNGLSYATEVPRVEKEYDEDAVRVLNYLLVELTFGLPEQPRWSFSLRIHHRSDVFGLFEGGGSNFLCGGIKHSF